MKTHVILLTAVDMLRAGFPENFVYSHLFTQRSEGGWCNLQDDPGGETLYGIARNYNPKWSGWGVVDLVASRFPKGTVSFKDEIYRDTDLHLSAANILYAKYFLRTQSQQMQNELAVCVYDFAVHAGPARSIKTLQKALTKCGVYAKVDGIIGKATLGAIVTCILQSKARQLIEANLQYRKKYYLRSSSRYRSAWLNRLSSLSLYIFNKDVTMEGEPEA